MHKLFFFAIFNLLLATSVQAGGDLIVNLLPRFAVDPYFREVIRPTDTLTQQSINEWLDPHGYIANHILSFQSQARVLASRRPNGFNAADFEHAVRSLIELTKQGAYDDTPVIALNQNDLGCTLLKKALLANNLRAVFILIGENILNVLEQDALEYAIQRLLSLQREPNNTLRDSLNLIIDCYDWDSIENTIVRLDSTVTAEDSQALLFWAARHGSPSIIEQAIEQGANVDAFDDRGRTALHTATARGHLNAIIELVEDGAEDLPTRDGNYALHIAAARGDVDLVDSILKWYEHVEWDDVEGIDKPGHLGQTALHIAVSQYNLKLFKLLIDAGANLEARDQNNATPLDLIQKMESGKKDAFADIILNQSTSSSSSWQ